MEELIGGRAGEAFGEDGGFAKGMAVGTAQVRVEEPSELEAQIGRLGGLFRRVEEMESGRES
jgi:hypothetical protein